MEFDAHSWTQKLGRPLPPLMTLFFEWVAQFEYGDLGYFELCPENLATGSGWDDMQRWGTTTWGFMRLGEGSVIALCEAVQPPAVVLVDSEGDLRTLAESFEAFLLDWAAGEAILCDAEEEENRQETITAFKAWLKKNKVKAPAVAGPFEFASYVGGDHPQRIVPGQKASAPVTYSAHYLAMTDGMGPILKALCDVLGRTADDAEVCAITQQLFGKTPPQSIGNAKHDDTEGMFAKKVDFELTFSRKVLNQKYAPVAIGKKAICPFFSRINITSSYDESILFGVGEDVLLAEIERRFPGSVKNGTDYFGDPQTTCELLLDEVRDIRLNLWTSPSGLRGCVKLAEGRELKMPSLARNVNAGVGLFVQWTFEKGWLERTMFVGHEALLDGMSRREVRPARLIEAALVRGLWDTHLCNEPCLRNFAYRYFHNMGGLWITADLKEMFGKREGPYGHDEPVLDDDAPAIFDRVFAMFEQRFKEWKHAHPDTL